MKFILDSVVRALLALILMLVLQVVPAFSASPAEPVPAVPPASGPVAGMHEIGLRVGFLDQGAWSTGIFHNGLRSEFKYGGAAVGALSYAYWIRQDLTLDLEAGGSESRVGHILFGARYYPSKLALTPAVRPCFSVAAGPIMSSTERIVIRPGFPFLDPVRVSGNSDSVLDVTAGARVAAGIDIFLQRRFKVGVFAGYRFSNGLEIEGLRRNTGGPEFSIAFGILLGGHRAEVPSALKENQRGES